VILVHGDFGCGKTTTAKQLAAELYDDYLRGNVEVPKVLYLDVNNIDIRARRDECIQSQLSQFKLTRDQIDRLVYQVSADQIHLIFDGIDEMARPYTTEGRRQTVEILRDIINRRPAAYFVRTSFFPKHADMIGEFSALADHDFKKDEKQMVVTQLLGLRQEQVNAYLDSRLGPEDARTLRGGLHRLNLTSFLEDPLIISLVTDLIEREGPESIQTFPRAGEKARFLSYLVQKLLRREQGKRNRHGALAENFRLFQKVLRSVAFDMTCRGSSSISSAQLEAYVSRASEGLAQKEETVDAFRTMSWIHREEDGALAFRHEALTLVCAAEHVCSAFERRDSLSIADWQVAAPLAAVVCGYGGETISSAGVLGATVMLAGDLQFNVRQLASSVLDAAKERQDFEAVPEDVLDEKSLAAICVCLSGEPRLSQLIIRPLFTSLSEKRLQQVRLVLLWLIAGKDAAEFIELAMDLVRPNVKPNRNFTEDLQTMKGDPSTSLDLMLLKHLGISPGEVFDSLRYEPLFKKISIHQKLDTPMEKYTDRTLRAFEGERHRREAAHSRRAKGKG
jgi:hypothetical protein